MLIDRGLSYTGALERLNELVEADPDAIGELLGIRVPCNLKLAEHPTAQVNWSPGEGFKIGLMGVLNALFGKVDEGPCEGWGVFAAVFDDDGTLLKFQATEEIAGGRDG